MPMSSSSSTRPGLPRWRRWGKPPPRGTGVGPSSFPPLRPLAAHRLPQGRGKFGPLSTTDRRRALKLVVKDSYAASSRRPNRSKMRTITKYLACFDLALVPFTARVVRALGAALTWRKYRATDQYLYAARAMAERRGAVPSLSTLRVLKDTIRSCRRGLGPTKRCEGLVLEAMASLPGAPESWHRKGPWRPRASLTLVSLCLL